MIKKAFLILLSLFLISATPTSNYSTKKNFEKKISSTSKTYVVYGADWCPPCVRLKAMLKEAGIDKKIVFLNASEPWVAELLSELEYSGIPYTVVYQNGKPTGVIRVGFSESLIFLISNIESK